MLEVQDGEEVVLWLHSTIQTMQVSVLSAEQAAERDATPDPLRATAMQDDAEAEYCVVSAASTGALPEAERVLPPAQCWRAAQAMMQERRRSGEVPEQWRRWCAALRCLLHRLQLDSPSLRYPSDHSSSSSGDSSGGMAPTAATLDRCSPLAKGVVFSSQMVDVAMRLNGVELTKAVSVATVPAHFPASWHAVASGKVPAGAAEQHLGPAPEPPPLHPQRWTAKKKNAKVPGAVFRSLSAAPTMRSLSAAPTIEHVVPDAAGPAGPAGPAPEVACSLEEVRCRGRRTLLSPTDAEQLRRLLAMPVAEVAALAQRLSSLGAIYAAAADQGKPLPSELSWLSYRRRRWIEQLCAEYQYAFAAAVAAGGSAGSSSPPKKQNMAQAMEDWM